MKPLSPLRFVGAFAVLAGAAFLASCATQSASQAPVAAAPAVDPALLDPTKNSAVRPEPRDEKWMKRHEGFVAEAKKGGIDVLFMGDSITDFWRDPKRGLPVWNREFAPLHAANFGISADRTQHVLWRLQHGEVDGIKPKVVVLMIGTNNTGLEKDKTPRNTAEQAAEGVKAVVRELRSRLPQSKILLLAVFPRGELPSYPQRAQIAVINREIAKLADGKKVRFLDIGPKFLTADGVLTKEIMPDALHPGTAGYEIWVSAMKPTLLEMLKQ